MKAIVYTEYGPPEVLRFTEVAKPIPKDDEVLVQVRAAAVNALDWRLMRGKPLLIRLGEGLRRPKGKRPGVDLAGRAEAVGRNVTRFKAGDDVFGACTGAFAEYACAPEANLALKPSGISFEEAAAVPVAASTALQGLRDKGRIRPGCRVAVDGASGGVGTFAIQIAKSFGAEVTAVCSTRNLDTARSLGADHVIDYTQADFTRSGERYDLIFAANAHRSIFAYRRALGRGGIHVMAGGGLSQAFQAMLLGPLLSLVGTRRTRFFIASLSRADLDALKDLLAAGKISPFVDRRYPLSRVAEAIRYVEAGHARGKVVIAMEAAG